MVVCLNGLIQPEDAVPDSVVSLRKFIQGMQMTF